MSLASLERWEQAVEMVYDRVRKVAATLDRHGLSYQVVGGLAVAAWVHSSDPEAVRATRDVDLVVRREDLPAIQAVLEKEGYRYREAAGLRTFLIPGSERASSAIHVLFSDEKVRPQDLYPVPALSQEPPRPGTEYAVAPIHELLRMKLTSFHLKDKVHILDMIRVGLITPEIENTLPPDLMARFQELKDNPDA